MKHILLLGLLVVSQLSFAKPRARELGIPFEGQPGPLNAITDVAGVEVGHVSIIAGKGKLQIGKGPIRTGVTVIHPRGKDSFDPVFAGWSTLNGNGEMTGTTWVEESGFLEGPVALTNTYSVGTVHEAVVTWRIKQGKPEKAVGLPVVGETWDGYLNDDLGLHVKEKHVHEALNNSKGGVFAEGAVGSGTGMVCFEFKCGIGTSSRVVESPAGRYTVGVLVQANFGLRPHLRVAGIPVGKELKDGMIYTKEKGSILVIMATDAPLLSHQLKRLARRASLGLGRVGSVASDSSGDIFLAFSTANPNVHGKSVNASVNIFPNDPMTSLFEGAVDAVEESIINALVAAQTMEGIDNHKVFSIPIPRLLKILARHHRLEKTPVAR